MRDGIVSDNQASFFNTLGDCKEIVEVFVLCGIKKGHIKSFWGFGDDFRGVALYLCYVGREARSLEVFFCEGEALFGV